MRVSNVLPTYFSSWVEEYTDVLHISFFFLNLEGFPDSSVGKKYPPAMQEALVQFLGGKIRWRRDRLPTPAGKESTCSVGDHCSQMDFTI